MTPPRHYNPGPMFGLRTGFAPDPWLSDRVRAQIRAGFSDGADITHIVQAGSNAFVCWEKKSCLVPLPLQPGAPPETTDR